MNDVSFLILKIVVIVAVMLITGFLIPFIKNLIASFKDERVRKLVTEAVQAAEQTIKGAGSGAVKKEEVWDFVSKWLGQHGIDISSDQLDKLIESAVFAMNLAKDNANKTSS